MQKTILFGKLVALSVGLTSIILDRATKDADHFFEEYHAFGVQ